MNWWTGTGRHEQEQGSRTGRTSMADTTHDNLAEQASRAGEGGTY